MSDDTPLFTDLRAAKQVASGIRKVLAQKDSWLADDLDNVLRLIEQHSVDRAALESLIGEWASDATEEDKYAGGGSTIYVAVVLDRLRSVVGASPP